MLNLQFARTPFVVQTKKYWWLPVIHVFEGKKNWGFAQEWEESFSGLGTIQCKFKISYFEAKCLRPMKLIGYLIPLTFPEIILTFPITCGKKKGKKLKTKMKQSREIEWSLENRPLLSCSSVLNEWLRAKHFIWKYVWQNSVSYQRFHSKTRF